MTDRIEALRALRHRVRSGEDFVGKFAEEECGFQRWQAVCIQKVTVDGSLNAARGLHEEVLPGWGWGKFFTGEVYVSEHGPAVDDFTAKDDDPARSWVIAILSALIAIEEQSQ